MSRESFLARVREAAQAGRRYRVTAGVTETRRVGYALLSVDLIARLLSEVTAVGGQAHRAANREAARSIVENLLQQHSARTALCWQHPTLDALGIGEVLSSRGVDSASYDRLAAEPPEAQRLTLLAADIGITAVDWAVAETGTLALCSAPGRERLASLLPLVHVALVPASRIVADLFDLFDRFEADGNRSLPSNLALITGPSKTGDVELKLTTGVHGPGVWHVVAIDEL